MLVIFIVQFLLFNRVFILQILYRCDYAALCFDNRRDNKWQKSDAKKNIKEIYIFEQIFCTHMVNRFNNLGLFMRQYHDKKKTKVNKYKRIVIVISWVSVILTYLSPKLDAFGSSIVCYLHHRISKNPNCDKSDKN